jgi:hypothetical protein
MLDMFEADVHPCELENDTMLTGRCRPIIISSQVPLSWALPLYGYMMPIIVAITVATNSFIVIVLSHKYLRTPTNYVLLAMAVTELLTGLCAVPWLLFYYTFSGWARNLLVPRDVHLGSEVGGGQTWAWGV